MSANDIQIGGSHYQRGGQQHWDFVSEYNIPYVLAVPVKYLTRWEDKGGVEDLRKAAHFLQKALEVIASPGYPGLALQHLWVRPSAEALEQYVRENRVGPQEALAIQNILGLDNQYQLTHQLNIAQGIIQELINAATNVRTGE